MQLDTGLMLSLASLAFSVLVLVLTVCNYIEVCKLYGVRPNLFPRIGKG